MRRRLALLCALLSTVAGLGWVASPSAAPAPLAAAKTCSSSYVLAHLSWGDKCLRAGEFCKVGNKEYLAYGFFCPATGHLRRP
jgi:hypothetical protein